MDTFFIQDYFAYLHKQATPAFRKGRGVTDCHLPF